MEARETAMRVTRWRSNRYQDEVKTQGVIGFYNSESLPPRAGAKNSKKHPSLGIGYRHIERKHSILMDAIKSGERDADGPVSVANGDPLQPTRAKRVERAISGELNSRFLKRYKPILRAWAGAGLVSGKGWIWRASRWDADFRNGSILAPEDAPEDIHDDNFREWAFVDTIKIRDLDMIIAAQRNAEKGKGWSDEGLMNLKKWMLEGEHTSRTDSTKAITRQMVMTPWPDSRSEEHVTVAFYFRKSDKHAIDPATGIERPEPKVDLEIVSLHGLNAETTATKGGYHTRFKNSEVDREQTLYRLEGAFETVDECLIGYIHDTRICGDPKLHDVTGIGRVSLNRLLIQERLMHRLAECGLWMAAPNWTSRNGPLNKDIAKQIEAHGLPPYRMVPEGFELLDKSKSVTSSNSTLNLLQGWGASIEQDSHTGEVPMSMGRTVDTNFKAEALRLGQQVDNGSVALVDPFLVAVDALITQYAKTLLRPINQYRKSDAAYRSARDLHYCLTLKHELTPREFELARLSFAARRFAGGGDRQAALNRYYTILQNPEATPRVRSFAWRNILAVMFGDSVADEIEPEDPSREPANILQNVHLPAMSQAIQAATAQGFRSASDSAAFEGLVNAAVAELGKASPKERQSLGPMIEQAYGAFAQIPLNAPGTAFNLEQQKLQLKEREQQLREMLGESLVETRAKAEQRKDGDQSRREWESDQRILNEEEEAQSRVQKNQAQTSKLALESQPQQQPAPISIAELLAA